METVYQRVAGLDIHKENIVACLRKTGSDGAVDEDIRTRPSARSRCTCR